MSRRRSTSSAMGPPPDRDTGMGPPPVPVPSSPQKGKDGQDISEKYRKLKRRFFELEEKHKETSTELQRSGERNVKMREERNILLDRIIELETDNQPFRHGSSSVSPPHSMPMAQPSSSAFPRTLLNARARTSFLANLRQAIAEDAADDDLDPLLTSRHAGPETRRRSDDDRRERLEEEAREHRQNARRTRSSHAGSSHNSGESSMGAQDDLHHNSQAASGKTRRGSSGRIPSQSDRLTPPGNHSMASSSRGHSRHPPLPSTQSHPHLYTHPPPAPPPHFQQQHNHYSHQHQRQSLSPDPDDYAPPSPGSGMDIDGTDDRGEYDYSPPPSHPHRTSGNKQDRDYDRDHHSNGDVESNMPGDSNINPTFPLHNEGEGMLTSSRGHEPTAPPGRREGSRTRRSSRIADHPEPESGHEPVHKTRASTKRGAAAPPAVGARLTRSESAALAAAAKAEAQARVSTESENHAPSPHAYSPAHDQMHSLTLPSAASHDPTPPTPSVQHDTSVKGVPQAASTSAPPKPPSQPVSAPSPVVQNVSPPQNLPAATSFANDDTPIDPAILSTSAQQKSEASAKASSKEPSPMENIVKVAEAAVAAQNAANAAQSTIPTPAPSVSPTPSQAQTQGASSNRSAASPTVTTPTTAHFGANPYMMATGIGIATAVKPTITTMGPGMPTMIAHPLAMNPYAMYYPPGTPVTPNTPTYAHPYANPYYYLAAAPMAGPSGMYPTSPTFIPPSAQRPPSEVQRHAKPKRLKAHTVTSRNFSIPMVPRDKRGKPMLPLNVGIMTVINLGDVCMREHFHTERYIFPVGYEVTRRYLSTVDPTVEVVYHCTILDGGDGPKFQIVPSDVPDRPVIAGTATGAWSNIVKQANAIRNRQHSNSVSGPDFFGLGQNTIKHLIQELPNADRLRDYVWQNFIEGGPLGGRHAAVIPALPEEYDASMPIGAYYPSEREKAKRAAGSNADVPRGMSHYPQHIVAQAEAQRAQQQALAQAQQQNPQQPQQSGQQSGNQQQQQQPVQQGGNQATSAPSGPESMNFQNYQHQGGVSRNASASCSGGVGSPDPGHSSRSPSAQPHNTRSTSQSQPPPGGPHHSPYLPTAKPPPVSSTAVPAVPATFASIMNAYPAPGGPGPNE